MLNDFITLLNLLNQRELIVCTEKKGRRIGRIIYTDLRSYSGYIISNDADYKIYYFEHASIDRNYHQFGERVFFEVKKHDGKEHAEKITVVLE